jgi:hypothetical protein
VLLLGKESFGFMRVIFKLSESKPLSKPVLTIGT